MEEIKKGMPHAMVQRWIGEVNENATDVYNESVAAVLEKMKRDVQQAGYDLNNDFVWAYLESMVIEWKKDNKPFLWTV